MSLTIKEFQHLRIKLTAIQSATNNFEDSNCIGKGGFGKVYKGELVQSNGDRKTTVAVKRLDRKFGQGDPEFWKEIMTLSFYKHPNIVSLLGFCDESKEKILVYEYASRRSLDLYLHSVDLTWIQRLKVCVGAARGLEYLHDPKGTQQRILHRDVKSANILLDENWEAKISDFGLSKIGPANQQYSFLVSNMVGTAGYCDPLYAEMGFLTKESDVFSFGVVLFEVLCGRLCICNYNNERRTSFVRLAKQSFEQFKLNEIVFDPIKGQINSESLRTFATIAYKCLKTEREERPTMTQIVKELEIALEFQAPNTLGAGPAYEPIQFFPTGPPVPFLVHVPYWYTSNESLEGHVLPERPGEPECVYYMKTGDCKFGSSCKFHHPPALNPLGLPLRPGAPICAYYARNNACKFGSSCKFDHPMGQLT